MEFKGDDGRQDSQLDANGTFEQKTRSTYTSTDHDDQHWTKIKLKPHELQASMKINTASNPATQHASEYKITSKIHYSFKSFFVTHPRLLSLYLLNKSIWPRGLALFDIYTDIQVTIDLYQSKSSKERNKEYLILFASSILFISFSFIMLWSVSLRFIETFWNKHKQWLNNHHDSKNNKNGKILKITMNVLLTIYLFPPVGCLLVSLYEIYYILYDIYCGVYSFMKGEILIIDKDSKRKAFKQFRRIVEFFGESIPQLCIQTFLFVSNIDVDEFDLYLSIASSTFHLFYHCYTLNIDAQYHGMTFAEYSINVLHLGEIPIAKLVPRLPAIEKGKVTQVNFGDFIMDKQSIGTIIHGLSSPLSKLNTMRITIGSIKNLDTESCRTLGAFLKRKNIKVIISQTVDSQEILKMFKKLDTQSKGYLNRQQFDNARSILTSSNAQTSNIGAINYDINATNLNEIDLEDSIEVKYYDADNSAEIDEKMQQQAEKRQRRTTTMSMIFDRLAIRKNYNSNNSDRIYFIDFYESLTKAKQRNFLDSRYDITSIKYPMQFIFEHLVNCVKHFFLPHSKKSQGLIALGQLTLLPNTISEWSSRINSLSRLFHFLLGLGDQLSYGEQGNILTTIITTHFTVFKIVSKNGKANKTFIDGHLKLCELILWFLDKSLHELLKLQSVRNMITKRYKHGHSQALNSLELALTLKQFSPFVIMATNIDNNTVTDVDIVDWYRLDIGEWNSTDITKLLYLTINDESHKLMRQLFQVKQIATQMDMYKLLQMITYSALRVVTPNNGM